MRYLVALLFASVAFAQTGTVNIIGGKVDLSTALHTLPMIVVANTGALPATCSVGELAMVTGATLGQQIYQCSAGNVWTQQLNSGTATGGGITMYSATGLTVTANTYYIPLGGGGSISTTEADVDIDSPAAATITNMYVQLSVALGMGNSGVFTMRKAGVSQSVTCTISGASATSCSDTTHSFNVSQGDLLTIQLVTTGTVIVTPNILIATQFGNITATGTVNTGTTGQVAYYASNGAAISGTNALPNGTTATTQSTGDGTTKVTTDAFVATALQAINPATNVQVSTTTVLPNTPAYNNGTAGVGATLTAGSNTTLAAIDGYSVQLNDRILVQNQVATANNGVYALTATGSGSAPWVLTRAVDYNTPTNINYTGNICTLQVGSTYAADTCFLINLPLVVTVGTTAITYTQQASGSNAGKPGGGVNFTGNTTPGDLVLVGPGASGKNIKDGGTAIPSGFTATTQSACDNSTKVATTAYGATACNLVKASGSPFAATAQSQTLWNNTSSPYVVDLPATASGIQICLGNYKTVAQVVSFVPPSGSTIYYKGVAGTTSSATGLTSPGTAGDFICLEAVDSTNVDRHRVWNYRHLDK